MNVAGPLLSLLVLAPSEIDRAPPLAALVGDEAPFVVELADGGAWVDLALESDLWRRLRATPEIEAALASPDVRRARSGLAMFAGLLDRSSVDAVKTVLGRELAAAVTPRGPGDAALLVAVRLEDPDEAERLGEVVDHFLTLIAGGDGERGDGPIRSVNGKEFHAVLADAFLVSNDRAALAAALQRADGASPAPPARPTGRGRLAARADLEWLRRANPEAALPLRFDNAVASLLLHGLNAAANRSTRADARLEASAGGVDLAVTFDAVPPDEAAWTSPAADGTAPPPTPAGTLAALTLRRDLDGFYERRLELLDPSIEEKVVEFDNVVSIFFGGRSFGEEILPALGDRATLLVGEQRYEALPARPDVRLPGFALVVPIVDPALRKSDLLVAFQTVVGIVNADRAQKGLASMMLSTERVDGIDVASARWMLEDDEEARELRMNASPAVAVVDGHLVVGSARDHVLDVVAALRRGGAASGDDPSGRIVVRGEPLRAALADNREALVANRMIEEGETRAEAESFWSRADQVLSLLDEAIVRLEHEQGGTTLRLSLRPFAADEGPEGDR
ncbi:MAG: hypothetical protein ACF8XB_04635 [Planctomycetota bacterium JB042]